MCVPTSTINHEADWFSGQELFQKNHKLIDHIKKNPRIIAQQGAFILFQGERLSSFPNYRYEAIKIDKNAKVQLRNDLRLYFGIHTGSIYPEEFNLVSEMIRKSERVSSESFSLEGEMNLIFHLSFEAEAEAIPMLDLISLMLHPDEHVGQPCGI